MNVAHKHILNDLYLPKIDYISKLSRKVGRTTLIMGAASKRDKIEKKLFLDKATPFWAIKKLVVTIETIIFQNIMQRCVSMMNVKTCHN